MLYCFLLLVDNCLWANTKLSQIWETGEKMAEKYCSAERRRKLGRPSIQDQILWRIECKFCKTKGEMSLTQTVEKLLGGQFSDSKFKVSWNLTRKVLNLGWEVTDRTSRLLILSHKRWRNARSGSKATVTLSCSEKSITCSTTRVACVTMWVTCKS